MSLQIAILKVLSCHPGGRASVAVLKADLAILATSGREWTERMKKLAERAPALDAFGQRYVLRDAAGWQLTESGRDFLNALERPRASSQAIESVASVNAVIARPSPSVIRRPSRSIRTSRTGGGALLPSVGRFRA